jgi:hypothetical protein
MPCLVRTLAEQRSLALAVGHTRQSLFDVAVRVPTTMASMVLATKMVPVRVSLATSWSIHLPSMLSGASPKAISGRRVFGAVSTHFEIAMRVPDSQVSQRQDPTGDSTEYSQARRLHQRRDRQAGIHPSKSRRFRKFRTGWFRYRSKPVRSLGWIAGMRSHRLVPRLKQRLPACSAYD